MFTNRLSNQERNNNLPNLFDDYEVQESFPITSVRPLESSNCSEYVVAHVLPKEDKEPPIKAARNFSEVVFLPYILETMRQMGFYRLLRLQSYAWPHLNQGSGHGAIIVSAPRSGRSLCYIPPMCQAIVETLKARRQERMLVPLQSYANYQGTVSLVIVPDLKRAHQIAYLCNRFLRKAKNEEWLTLTLTVPSSPKRSSFYLRLLNGSGCLVATLAQFIGLCEQDSGEGLLHFPNLRFVVYDDIDLMETKQLEQAHYFVKTFIKGLQLAPQFVIISQTFRKYFLNKLMKDFSSKRSLIIFGDLLEAALYGGTSIRLSLVTKESKLKQVLEVLKERPPQIYRTLIYCQDDMEIKELLKQLWLNCKHECLAYYQDDGLDKQMQVHKWLKNSQGLIFLCTDNCPEAEIRSAQTLLHYSMSQTWSKFKMRHLSISQGNKGLSLALLDNENVRQLPRLVDFLEMHQEVDSSIKQIIRQIRDKMNLDKANEPALCSLLLTHGECRDSMCEERHQLIEADQLAADSPLLDGVNIKVQLVKVFSPAHFCVRLLEYLPLQGSWQKISRNSTLDLRLQVLQADQQTPHYWPPRSGDICIYLSHHTNSFERVRILRVPEIQHRQIYCSDLKVEVQALDVDTRRFFTRTGQLFVCPEELMEEPPISFDLRLLGVVPSWGERSWHPDDEALIRQVKFWLTKSAAGEAFFLQADIKFALKHTIFVNDLVVMAYAPTFKKHVRHLRLVHALRRLGVARSDEAKSKILNYFEDNIREQMNQEENGKEIEIVTEEKEFVTEEKVISPPNRLQRILSLARKMTKKTEDGSPVTKPPPPPPSPPPTDSFGDLLKCIAKCSAIDDPENSAYITEQKEFFEQLLNTDATPPIKLRKSHIQPSPLAKKSVLTSIQIPNAIQPEVTYYQTARTLELQLTLHEEHVAYNVYLANLSVIIFEAPTNYRFVINTYCPYQGLAHRMKGRCVYVKVYKTLARSYPLEFSQYTFMKANHDQFLIIDNYRKQRVQEIENYILKMGYATSYLKGNQLYKDDDSEENDSENELDDDLTEKANPDFDCD